MYFMYLGIPPLSTLYFELVFIGAVLASSVEKLVSYTSQGKSGIFFFIFFLLGSEPQACICVQAFKTGSANPEESERLLML